VVVSCGAGMQSVVVASRAAAAVPLRGAGEGAPGQRGPGEGARPEGPRCGRQLGQSPRLGRGSGCAALAAPPSPTTGCQSWHQLREIYPSVFSILILILS